MRFIVALVSPKEQRLELIYGVAKLEFELHKSIQMTLLGQAFFSMAFQEFRVGRKFFRPPSALRPGKAATAAHSQSSLASAGVCFCKILVVAY